MVLGIFMCWFASVDPLWISCLFRSCALYKIECFLIVEYEAFFLYFTYKHFIKYVFCNNFPQSFKLLNSVFSREVFFILMKSNVSVLSWIILSVFKESSQTQGHLDFILHYLLASYYTFRSVIHFELIFVKSVRFVSILILLHIDTQLSNTIYWKD